MQLQQGKKSQVRAPCSRRRRYDKRQTPKVHFKAPSYLLLLLLMNQYSDGFLKQY